MNLSTPFIRRPIGTLLLTVGLALAGIAAFFGLPVAPLPQVDLPTISVQAALSGASPSTMASSIAGPLERRLGQIAGVTEMTSQSGTGSTRITLQFDLSRDIDGAARDVQAAINAARADLPPTLRQNPTYRKINPADAPIMILALTSATRTPAQVFDAVSNIVQQRLLQVEGVGDVELGGAALPGVRVDVNSEQLAAAGISLEDVRAALSASSANRPRGLIDGPQASWVVYGDAPGRRASDFADLPVAWRNGALVRLRDVASVSDGPEDARVMGLVNGQRAVPIIISRQPGANIVQVVDAIKTQLPGLAAALPADVKLAVASDRTTTIRASLREVETTLVVATLLVVAVVSLFLGSARATVVPFVAVVVSLLGTLGVMYLLGFSLDNLSLMALTVATGFVVDDAIVVLENIARHREDGVPAFEAALVGAREVGFTVVSISLSLVAVFIPLLFLGGIVGRIFREFAVTMAVAVLISLVISLTTTPMIASRALRGPQRPFRLARWTMTRFERLQARYARSLDWAIAHRGTVLAILLGTVLLNGLLIAKAPKGFFPEQDTGSLIGGLRADQSLSFTNLSGKLTRIVEVVRHDPGVATVVAFTGGSRAGSGFMFVQLKPQRERDAARVIIARLRPKLQRISGIQTFLSPVQDLRVGGRSGNANYQYTLSADDSDTLGKVGTALRDRLRASPALTDVDIDQQDSGAEAYVTVDRDAAARLGVSAGAVDNALYDSFGQRQVATIYSGLNQYHVVLGVPLSRQTSPVELARVEVPATGTAAAATPGSAPVSTTGSGSDASSGQAVNVTPERLVPLPTLARVDERAVPAQINHQGGRPAATIAFNTATGKSLSDAAKAIDDARGTLAMPTGVTGGFAGTAQQFQQSFATMPLLIGAALLTIYIVLGILYESAIHPLTVLSTIPSAGVGAMLALILTGGEFDLIALIGIILLIGIVKKNAILIIDFALEAERDRGLAPEAAIREAALLRFRPILMTTLAAALGAVPLAIGFGEGAELRRPLGIAIIGGLVASQLLTLLTTPAVYLALDRFRRRPRAPALVPA